MLTTSSRPTSLIARLAGCVAAACLALLAVSSAPALAASSTCEGQTFSQPFEALGDFNYYTLVPGAQFNGPSEGWRLSDGAVDTRPRDGDGATVPAGIMEVETGDGVVRLVDQTELPGVLRAALDAGQAIRRVQPAPAEVGRDDLAEVAGAAPRRAGAAYRVLYGAAHRARLLAASQWFLAPALLFLFVLGIIYAGDAGPPLQAAAVTAITLVPVLTWLSVLAHRVDGRELARAFAAHAGGPTWPPTWGWCLSRWCWPWRPWWPR